MARDRPLSAAVWAALGLALLVLAVAAISGFLVVAGVVAVVLVLNLVYLPRAAQRLRLTPALLAVLLLPLFMAVGWALVREVQGAAWGAGVWILSIGLPRVAIRRLAYRLTSSAAWRVSRGGAADGSTLEGITCPRCGTVSVPSGGEPFTCAHCATPALK
jgi:hypothetical protein